MKRRILSAVFALALVGQMSAPCIAVEYGAEINPEDKTYDQSFSDVAPDHWAFTYIEDLVERGAIN